MSFLPKHSEGGSIHLAIVFLVVVLVVSAGVGVFVKTNKSTDDSQKDDLSQAAALTSASRSSLEVNQYNTGLKNDASRLLAAVAEYMNNNQGQMPMLYAGDTLSGGAGTTETTVSFDLIKSVTIAQGSQPAASATSELRLVTHATCGQSGETVAASSPRNHVVQFVLEKTGGGHTSDCKEG